MHTKCSKHSLILMVALSVRAAFISQMPVGSMEKKISLIIEHTTLPHVKSHDTRACAYQ